jgi:hypothetical protein
LAGSVFARPGSAPFLRASDFGFHSLANGLLFGAGLSCGFTSHGLARFPGTENTLE